MDVTPPTNGSLSKVKYTPPPVYSVVGPALAGFENTNRVASGAPHQEKPGAPAGKVDDILAERGKRYGTFEEHARAAQMLKQTIDRELDVRQKSLKFDQKQALDVICDKIARIINGDPDYVDNWDDIAGYATLISRRLTDGQT